MPNVLYTPHIAGTSKEVVIRASTMIAKDIKNYLLGLPLLNEV